MRGATHYFYKIRKPLIISIHAPHAGCDIFAVRIALHLIHFNPRTPCGVRRCSFALSSPSSSFQSTHPMRGATRLCVAFARLLYISIHAPHAGCDRTNVLENLFGGISIHAPHAGCDVSTNSSMNSALSFQSTHPMRGATQLQQIILSHPPHFNPRTPCGVRPEKKGLSIFCQTFQSTHPMRGATYLRQLFPQLVFISIHAPHAGCDFAVCSSLFL